MVQDKFSDALIPQRIQSTLQFIPLTDTIKSRFQDRRFKETYIQQNSNRKHLCQNGRYSAFCCGQAYKRNQLYQSYPESLQIRISNDDFEICNPLQPRAGLHKVCAVYFTVLNMPSEFLSKLSNIHLVCLCTADDLKTRQTDFNDIWRLIVSDMKSLEIDGLEIDDNLVVRGTVSHLSADNLGNNVSQGFSAGFNVEYYCRCCLSSKDECQLVFRDDPRKHRTRDTYAKHIEIVESLEKIDYKETKGVKFYCALNDLQFFHILDNPSVDIMHDIFEGTVPFILKRFFVFCFKSKIFKYQQISSWIESYDFGMLNSRNVQSRLKLNKHNLGQSAIQMKCLFQHIPFILIHFKHDDRLTIYWKLFQSLLRIVETVCSAEITEHNLTRLENDVEYHLKTIKLSLCQQLIPKHHFMVHYAYVIRQMGPIVYMSMLRSEAKHQIMKKMCRGVNNFTNINKTIALKHQRYQALLDFSYETVIHAWKPSKGIHYMTVNRK